MSGRLLDHTRTIVTLAVLGLLLLLGVNHGLQAVSEPFPERADPPICTDNEITAGDILRASSITVSVLNAGERNGLALLTLDDLQDQGFARGELSNVPVEDVASAQIWSPGGRTAAVRLVRSYLGGKVQIIDRQASTAGITVVVGDQFPGVRAGKKQVKVTTDGVICSPAGLS